MLDVEQKKVEKQMSIISQLQVPVGKISEAFVSPNGKENERESMSRIMKTAVWI